MTPRRHPRARRSRAATPPARRPATDPWDLAPAPPRSRWLRRALIVGVGLAAGAGLGLVLTSYPPEPTPAAPRASDLLPWDGMARYGFCQGRQGRDCVIDGDSFRHGAEAVRLALIDAPEIGGARCPDERATGEAARLRLHTLLNAGPVRLVPAGTRDRDRYGRLLRDAEVNGRSVSDILVAEGLARPWGGRREEWC